MKIARLVPFVVLLAFGCASSSDLTEDGFTVSPAGPKTWWVSFEDDTSQERARDNLLYNSARLVLDEGGTYFTFRESDAQSRLNRQQTSSVEQDPTLDPTRDSYRSGVTVQRFSTASAVVEIVDGPGDGVLDASKVLEDLIRKYGN